MTNRRGQYLHVGDSLTTEYMSRLRFFASNFGGGVTLRQILFFLFSRYSGGRAAVDGSGYDGIRGAGSGPVLARDNVQR